MILLKAKLTFVFIFIFSVELNAQPEIRIEGSIVDSLSNPIPFSTITIIDAHLQGTYADIEGNFILKLVHLPVLLEISSIGYEKNKY